MQRAEIVYDIWDEKFSVRVTRGLGAELRALAATADEAIWRATALWQFPIADTNRLQRGRPLRRARARAISIRSRRT